MLHVSPCTQAATLLRVALVLMMATRLVVPASAQASGNVPHYEVDASWPKPLPNNWLIGQVGGLVVDKRDHIWATQLER